MGAAGLGLSGWVVVNHTSDIESPAAMTHRNAVLTPRGRYRLVMRVQAGRPIAHVAAEAGIARATLSKWLARYHQGGTQALEDRSSAPAHRPTRTSAKTVDLIEHWRRAHKWSARRISHELAARGTVVSVRTVTRWLDRAGLNRRRDIDPTGQSNRVVKPIVARFPGHMIHLDVKKVGRIPPASRLAGPRARNPQGQSLQTRQGSQDRLHLPAHRHRRLLPPGLHRGPRRREGLHHDRPLLPRPGLPGRPRRHQARASRHRQRGQLPRPDLHHDHHLPGLTPPEDPPPHPTAQRQGRALQPHPGRGAPLRPHLLLKAAAPRRRRGVEPPLQLPSTPHRLPQPATRAPTHVTNVMTSYN